MPRPFSREFREDVIRAQRPRGPRLLRGPGGIPALWNNTDARDVATARNVLDGRYTSLEEGILAHHDDRPWVASWEPGPTQAKDVRRRVGR